MGHFDKNLVLVASAALLIAGVGCAHNATSKQGTMERSSGSYSSQHTRGAGVHSDRYAYNEQGANRGEKNYHPSKADIRDHRFDRSIAYRFAPGTADLTDAGKSQLQQLVSRVKTRGDIDKAEIAAWSDRPFPKYGKDLSDKDQDLADKRADVIEKYLKDELKVSSVTTFNMAETSNWLARLFNTKDAELKSVFSKEGGTPLSREDFELMRHEGGIYKAVVVLTPKVDNNGNLKKTE